MKSVNIISFQDEKL